MGGFVTGQAARERFDALADAVDAAYAEMRELCSDVVGNDFRVGFAERLEAQERVNRGLMYRFFGEIADPPDEAPQRHARDRVLSPGHQAHGQPHQRITTALRSPLASSTAS